MKQVCFILHLYQPSIQSASVFKQVYETSYQPLLKTIKNSKNAKFTINVPLGFLDLLESYGYKEWIADLAKLVDLGKIELTGTASYHPILSRLNSKMLEDQIILHEYGLGYFFGKKVGFDGERSIVVKDLTGFFPPELAVNTSVLDKVSELGYSWVLVDECSVGKHDEPVLAYDQNLGLIIRDTEISNKVAFNRSFEPEDVFKHILQKQADSVFIAVDGETFGHHNKEGIVYFDNLVHMLVINGIECVTVSEALAAITTDLPHFTEVLDSSWGATHANVLEGNPLPFWQNDDNQLQKSIWTLLSYVSDLYADLELPTSESVNLENVSIWKNDTIDSIEDLEVKSYLIKKLAYMRLVSSDFLWWASNITLYNNQVVFDKAFISKYIEFAKTVSTMTSDEKLSELANKIENNL